MENHENEDNSHEYVRHPLDQFTSVSALFNIGKRRGIYVLEFSDGSFYVGQAENVVTRFAQHRHGHTNHDAPWEDIKAIRFLSVAEPQSLDEIEKSEILRFKSQGKTLRNKAMNIGHHEPSQLDVDIPVTEQEHWAAGNLSADINEFQNAASRNPCEKTKLFGSEYAGNKWLIEDSGELLSLAQLGIYDLAAAIACIPDAVNQEGIYWVVSDYPSTTGGRLLTLNVMSIEVLFMPRRAYETVDQVEGKKEMPVTIVNFPKGTIPFSEEVPENSPWQTILNEFAIDVIRNNSNYDLMQVDSLVVDVGTLPHVFSANEVRLAFTQLCLMLMRQNKAGLFRRWHSSELARLAYERVPEILGYWQENRAQQYDSA